MLYTILEDSEKYINDILGGLTSNLYNLRLNIFELLNKKKHLSRTYEIDKSILSLIKARKLSAMSENFFCLDKNLSSYP